jgi:hypothetical protein
MLLSQIIGLIKEGKTLSEGGQISKFNPKPIFDAFQTELGTAMEKFKATLKKSVVGREVAFRGAKGFGQIEQSHSTIVNDVDLVLYQDKYTILFKGTEGKSKKQHEYYIDPTSNISMNIKAGAPAADVTPEPAQRPRPVIRKVVTPQIKGAAPQAPKVATRPPQAPQR